jgi:hypothetical protein
MMMMIMMMMNEGMLQLCRERQIRGKPTGDMVTGTNTAL